MIFARCMLLVVLLGGAAVPALAQPDRGHRLSRHLLSEARKHFDSAQLFYEDGHYELARDEFSIAYQLSRLPDLLYNLAMTSEKLGDRQGAISYLERYLADRPDAEDAQTIRADIAALRSAPPEPAQPRTVSIRTERTDQQRQHGPSLLPGVILLGGGAVLALVGGGLGGGALAAAHSVQSQQDMDLPFGPDLQATQARGMAMSTAGITLDVIGAAAMIGGLAWTMVWVNHRNADRAAEKKP